MPKKRKEVMTHDGTETIYAQKSRSLQQRLHDFALGKALKGLLKNQGWKFGNNRLDKV